VIEIENCIDNVWNDLSASAQSVIDKQGIAYTDQEGDLVTSIVRGKECVFTFFDDLGDIHDCCLCALEKAYRAGKTRFCKPVSCALYPIREKKLGEGLVGLNYNCWDVCKMAIEKGKALDLPLYEFLRDPLIRRFGKDWYQDLLDTVTELKAQGYL
jgi:hypothetical protein